MLRRQILSLPLAAMTGAAAAGTALTMAAGSSAPARAADTAELTFWSWRQEDRAFYQKAIEAFRRTHPGIAVTFQGFEPTQYPTILSTALAGGKGPDIIQVKSYGGLAAVAAPGYLMPLGPDAVPELGGFSAPAVKALSHDGKPYAVPFAQQTMLLIANTEVMGRHGLALPRSWDELTEACRALKSKGVTPFANGTATAWQNETLTFALLSSLIGRDFVADVEGGRADFTDPRFTGALARLLAMRDFLAPNFTGVDYASSQQLFAAGRAAMFAGGSFELANFRAQNPRLKLDVLAPPPAKADDPHLVALYVDGGYAINAKTAQRDAAVAFLRHLASPEFGAQFANSLQNISPVPGVTPEDPLLAKVAALDASAIPYLMLVDFRYQEPNGSVLLQSGVQKMLAGQATPEQVGADITKGIATYHAPFRK